MSIKFIGTITGTKGFFGGLIVQNLPISIKDIKEKSIVKIGFSENFSEDFILVSFNNFNAECTIYLEGITSKEQGFKLKEKGIFVDDSDIVFTDKKSFLPEDLVGCLVYNHKNKNLIGIINDVIELPANDVWQVKTQEGELPVPAIDEVIKSIDIKNKRIEISLLDGLSDLLNL